MSPVANSIFNESVFADKSRDVYKHEWEGALHVDRLVGGVPSNPRVIEGWIKRNVGYENREMIQQAIIDTVVTEQKTQDEAIKDAIESSKLNRFRRDPEHGLFILGANLKSCMKEAANISWPRRRDWTPTKKGTLSFFAEHVFVEEKKLFLGCTEPTDVQQRFVSTWRGQSMVYEEYVDDAKFSFTVVSDLDISDQDWAELWLRAQHQGLGAVRSQGYGQFAVVRWDRLK